MCGSIGWTRIATEPAAMPRRYPHGLSPPKGTNDGPSASQYDDHHATRRTRESTLWINSLMTLYGCYDAPAVASRVLYRFKALKTRSLAEMADVIGRFRARIEPRDWQSIQI
jgi:hypothetical protein